MTGNVVISEVDALTLSYWARKRNVPYGELVGATECITL
jgi:hypothetical protein